jgi:uncharacterized membrane protein YdjX (TVP38/TMEM64 family)
VELRQATHNLASRITLFVFIIGGVILFFSVLKRLGIFDPEAIKVFAQESGPWAPLVLMTLVVIGSISLTIPSTPAMIILGSLYGPWLGALYSFIAVLIAASIAFAAARYFRKYILWILGQHADILVRFQKKYVASVIFWTRAIPLFSFEIISYAAGLTGITYRAYILATAIGIIPPILLYTTTGDVLLQTGGWILPIVMAVVMISIIFLIPFIIERYNPFGWKEKLLKAQDTKTKRKH